MASAKSAYMTRILEKAEIAFRTSGGNPCVGAMLVYDHRIIGEGIHEKYGEAHAEVNCIRSVSKVDEKFISKATLYVTLEPCNISGKTPPCVNLILKHKIQKVVIGTLDPNPLVAGNGVKILKAAGVQVEVGLLEEKAKFLIRKFRVNIIEKRCFVAIKSAVSQDGYAGKKDESIWLTNEFSRIYAHKLRGMFEGIVVGYNTVNLDNPLLTNREYYVEPYYNFHPVKIIVDKDEKLLANRKLFTEKNNIILTTESNYKNPNPQTTEIIVFPENDWNWPKVFGKLWQKGLHSLLIEGGPRLQKSIVRGASWDEAHILSSNKVLGGGIRAVNLVGKQVESLSLGDNICHHFIPYEL